jgi:NitT/TauT family transport system substrate-binding protein
MQGGRSRLAALAVATALVAAGCGDDGAGGEGEAQQARLILGWVASPQFGGYFAAQQQGYYEDAGLDVTLQGGEVESPLQVVASGGAEFGFGDADEILQARSQEIPIVGVFPTFSKALRILVYHEEEPVESFEELDGRDVYVDLGDAWWEYIVESFELTSVRDLAYNSQAFLQDETSVIQGYAGDQIELSATAPDANLGVINVADSGWNPYMQVLFASEDFVENNGDAIREFIDASIRGWNYYRENFHDVHVYMQDHGAEASPETMDEQAQLYWEYVFDAGFPVQMTEERWQATEDALTLTGVLTEDIDVSGAFTNEFIPS